MSYNALRIGRFSEPGREYFVTAVVHERLPVFADFRVGRLLVDQLRRLEDEGVAAWLAWVVMPDHFHGLVTMPDSGSLDLAMKRFKGRSARRVNRFTRRRGRLWQPGYYDHALRREEDRLAVARYIVANPLRSGLVSRIGDYPLWDSVWLSLG